MPEFLEAALRHAGKKHGLTGDHLDRYVYGGLNNLHAMAGNQITPKGEAMEAKHEADMKEKPKLRKLRVKRRHDLIPLR